MIYEPGALPEWEQKRGGGYWTDRIAERARRRALAELREAEYEITLYPHNVQDAEAEERGIILRRIEELRALLGEAAPPRPGIRRWRRVRKGAPRTYRERRAAGLCGSCAKPSGLQSMCDTCGERRNAAKRRARLRA